VGYQPLEDDGKFCRLSAAIELERRHATKQRLDDRHVPDDLSPLCGLAPVRVVGPCADPPEPGV
jgi:hypothetical protein